MFPFDNSKVEKARTFFKVRIGLISYIHEYVMFHMKNYGLMVMKSLSVLKFQNLFQNKLWRQERIKSVSATRTTYTYCLFFICHSIMLVTYCLFFICHSVMLM